jgi:hypothetical protein
MNKMLPFFLFCLIIGCSGQVDGNNTVYICNGPKSHAYHNNKSCRGLKRCSTDIESVSLNKATSELQRDPCDYCY